MQFDCDLFRARHGQNRQIIIAMKRNAGVSSIVNDQDAVLFAEGDRLFKESSRRRCTGRIIG